MDQNEYKPRQNSSTVDRACSLPGLENPKFLKVFFVFRNFFLSFEFFCTKIRCRLSGTDCWRRVALDGFIDNLVKRGK